MVKTRYQPDPDRDPVGPFLHYLMAECGVSPHTLAAYRSDLMHFLRWRKTEAPGPLRELSVGVLNGYVQTLHESGLAPRSICRHLASLSTFFRYLVFEGKLTDNLAKLLVAPAVWDRLPTVLGPIAVDRLLETPQRRDPAGPAGPGSTRDSVRYRLPGFGGRRPEANGFGSGRRPGSLCRQGQQGAVGARGIACCGCSFRLSCQRSSCSRRPASGDGNGAGIEVR